MTLENPNKRNQVIYIRGLLFLQWHRGPKWSTTEAHRTTFGEQRLQQKIARSHAATLKRS